MPKIIKVRTTGVHTTRHLTKWQLAWLAGFIDGEGSIGIYKSSHKSTGVRLRVTNTHPTIIDFIHTLTGIGRVIYVDKAKLTKCKGVLPQMVWEVSIVSEVRDIITKILPYLLVKTKQAIMMLEFCDGQVSGEPLHDDQYYHEKTRALNHPHGGVQ